MRSRRHTLGLAFCLAISAFCLIAITFFSIKINKDDRVADALERLADVAEGVDRR